MDAPRAPLMPPMQPTLAWTALSRNALAQAKAQLLDGATGVRDEVGVLALHTGYANRFFPGTSVQQSRLRYTLFVPWQLQSLLAAGVRVGQARGALRDAERALALRLPDVDGSGTIGRYTAKRGDDVSIPPSQSYWVAMQTWGVLAGGPGEQATRRAMYANWRRWAEAHPADARHALRDDDKTPLHLRSRLFIQLPPPPPEFHGDGALDFTLLPSEADFLRRRLGTLHRPHDPADALLARLVTGQHTPDDTASLYSDDVLALADSADRAALLRAKHAASLGFIARAVYNAAMEQLTDDSASHGVRRHRDHLALVTPQLADSALSLTLQDLALDDVHIGGLLPVLHALQGWLRAARTDPLHPDLRGPMAAWEDNRKGERARLPRTDRAARARGSWLPHKVGKAGPITYRWELVRRFLQDLAG